MKKILVINGHQYYPFAEGKLNSSLIERVTQIMEEQEYEIKYTVSEKGYDVEEELEKWLWADVVILQTPLNWMGVTWSFKKYLDEVKTFVDIN